MFTSENPLRVFEAFSGVGTQSMALKRLGIPYQVVAISEIDKHAIKSYEAIHGKTKNLGDISKLKAEEIPDHDLFTYSFPCQDISNAGRMTGLDKGSGTRSSLLWECERVIQAKRPKYLLLENVKALTSKIHIDNFETWLDTLKSYGYTNYWKIVNSKAHNIPQNRERVFVVSILGEHPPFEFPKETPLTIHLKDILEEEIEEKYFLNEEFASRFIVNPNPSTDESGLILAGTVEKEGWNDSIKRVYSTDGCAPCLTTMQGGHRQPKILHIINGTKQGYMEAEPFDSVNLAFSRHRTRRGRVGKQVAQTLDTACTQGVITENLLIRKLSPLECWRLMDMSNEDFYKSKNASTSDTQLYKQAGNAIVVKCLELLFRNLFKGEYDNANS